MRNISDPASAGLRRPGVDRRVLALVLAFVGAACLTIAAFSKSWMGNATFSGAVRDRDGRASYESGRYMGLRGDIRFGPLGFERCAKPYRGFEMEETPSEVECAGLSTAELNKLIGELDPKNRDRYTSGAFAPAGWLAFVTCLLAALGLATAGGLVAARKQKQLPVSPASVALLGIMGAMASGCVFIATKPGPAGMLGVDLGFWAFGAGTVLGILGAQLLAKELRPPDPDLLDGALDPDELSRFPVAFAPLAAPATPLPALALPAAAPAPAAESAPAESAAAESPAAESAATEAPAAESAAAEAPAESAAAESPAESKRGDGDPS